MSWGTLEWKQSGSETVTGLGLLGRTVFYKVGHHGSHNATLREKGLELMESPELVAMIPVSEKMAKKQRWNHMPLKSLVKRLNEKAHGRVLRVDMKGNDISRASDLMSQAEWNRFRKATNADRLYIEYTIAG